jgi:hypothetical protein
MHDQVTELQLSSKYFDFQYHIFYSLKGAGVAQYLDYIPDRRRLFFIFLAEVRPFLAQIDTAAHPSSYSVCTGRISLEVKRPEPEADLCPPSSADLSHAFPQSYDCMVRCLISTRQIVTLAVAQLR